jgi:hypothetical protein
VLHPFQTTGSVAFGPNQPLLRYELGEWRFFAILRAV